MRVPCLIAVLAAFVAPARAADDASNTGDYEARLRALEQRVQAIDSMPVAQPAATYGAPASASSFNPAIGVILAGRYAHFSRDPATYRLPGFSLGDEANPGKNGFGLGESELAMYANIDDKFYGNLIASITPDNTIAVEEGYVQTIGLPQALTVRAGRFYSGIGYLNQQHTHVWDFADAPLVYRAMLNNQYNDDGVQVRWLAPTDTFLELGAEALRGDAFPAGGAAINGTGSRSVFAHIGGDVGESNSWRFGLSHLYAASDQRPTADVTGGGDTFTGSDKILIADFVWKWAPQGNATVHNFKFQSEYFHRHEDGAYTIPAAALLDAPYRVHQSGWYAQGVYQFMPRWRAGLRYDALDPAAAPAGFAGTVLDPAGHRPHRESVMVDFSNSEFSRLRLQYNRDYSQPEPDNQVFLQYLMSIGAHGAHIF